MSALAENLIALLLIIGGLFALIGSFGLLKLRNSMQRLHAPTKATTVGVGSALVASALDLYWQRGVIGWQEVMVAVFLFMTAPLTALYLSKVNLHFMPDRGKLPATGTTSDWATFDTTLGSGEEPPPDPRPLKTDAR